MSAPYKGLTWDHPRGFNALDRAGRSTGLIHWDKQSLEGFESAPIGELCAAYDLVVLDHPHLGEALAENCLQPLDDVIPQAQLDRIAQDSIGPSFRSYVMDGRAWALPLDAASQVLVARPEYVDELPVTWEETISFARQNKCLALSLAGPHAFLSLMSIAAALDEDMDLADGGWIKNTIVIEAYELLSELYAYATAIVLDKNPIGILEHMSRTSDIGLCPLIYGYVPYALEKAETPLLFRDAPRRSAEGRPGSILGGTGIGISTRCKPSRELVEHLQWLMSVPAQTGFIPANDGQPSARAAWHNSTVNAQANGFYLQTSETLERAAVRPRHEGYIAFQSEASALIREALATGLAAKAMSHDLEARFLTSTQTQERDCA